MDGSVCLERCESGQSHEVQWRSFLPSSPQPHADFGSQYELVGLGDASPPQGRSDRESKVEFQLA